MDNFTGHTIQYQPKNITFIYFEPGLTSHVQPLDAGIIRCFKAHYRRLFCLRAIDQDDAEQQEIYKISLLDAMVMAEEAWECVSPTTIKNCWGHTEIQRPRLPTITLRPPRPPMPANLVEGWDIAVQYASEPWSLLDAHSFLQERLGDRYVASEWNEPLDTVLSAEDDVDAALAALSALRDKWAPDSPPDSCEPATTSKEQSQVEKDLLELITQLKGRRRIAGQLLTLDELLDPEEEREIGEGCESFEGGACEIVAMVQAEMGMARGEIEEIDSDSDDSGPEVVPASLKEMVGACRLLEENSMMVCPEGALEVAQVLRRYRGSLQRMSTEGAKQTTLDRFFNYKSM